MPTSDRHVLLTPRDLEILAALDYSPLTAVQLLKISQTFAAPFASDRRVRDRLQTLATAGWVRPWPYATASRGALNGYSLTRFGYRLLYGEKALPPTKRTFDPIGIARQHHAHSLADFIVHTAVAAHRSGAAFTGFARENTLRLEVRNESLYPDCGFQLIEPDGSEFAFFTEIDAGSERIRSPNDLESWERKIRLYDRLLDLNPKRFRVLVLTTRSSLRVMHILEAAAALVQNPQRSLLYGLSLPQYLATADPLRSACFRDHHGKPVSLLPSSPSSGLSPALSHPLRLLEASPLVRGSPPSVLSSLPTQALGITAAGV